MDVTATKADRAATAPAPRRIMAAAVRKDSFIPDPIRCDNVDNYNAEVNSLIIDAVQAAAAIALHGAPAGSRMRGSMP